MKADIASLQSSSIACWRIGKSYLMGYIIDGKHMEVLESAEYRRWFASLKDKQAQLRINARIRQLKSHGALMGDVKPVGFGVFEMRFHLGPGYRVYVSLERRTLLLLLVGGDKSTQKEDIAKARAIAKRWRSEHGQ